MSTRTQMQSLISKMPENKHKIIRNKLKVVDTIYEEMFVMSKKLDTKNPANRVGEVVYYLTENGEEMKDRFYTIVGTLFNNIELSKLANSEDIYNEYYYKAYKKLYNFFSTQLVISNRKNISLLSEDEISLMMFEVMLRDLHTQLENKNNINII